MNLLMRYGVVAVLSIAALMPGLLLAETKSEYVLGSGDLIRVLVYGEEDLTLEAQLTDSGSLSYPFLGDIQLNGMTAKKLEQTIDRGLRGDYLVDPRVSVLILQYRPFFINGEVNQPGGIAFQPGLTVRKAVSLAQGFTERASKRNIFIISDSDPGQRPHRTTLNAPVKPGDIITVEQAFF